MILFFFAVIVLSFYKIQCIRPGAGLNAAYLAPDRTTSIKGIFVLLVFLSHANNYLLSMPAYTADVLNQPYINFQSHLGQGVVVMFLFYSGYGVMESIKKKGTLYVHAIPKRRILKTLLHFDIAVLLYLFLDLALGTLARRSPLTVLLAFTGWTSLGNSNWYIFAVLMLYLFTFIAFSRLAEKPARALWVVTGFTAVYIAVLAFLKDAWWFDTVLLYPIGMWYSFGKVRIESFLRQVPSRLIVEALENTVIYGLPHDEVLALGAECYEIEVLYRGLLENSLILSQVKMDMFRMETANERYNRLLREQPEIIKRAPLSHIASYLLMTPETLSRVRASII